MIMEFNTVEVGTRFIDVVSKGLNRTFPKLIIAHYTIILLFGLSARDEAILIKVEIKMVHD